VDIRERVTAGFARNDRPGEMLIQVSVNCTWDMAFVICFAPGFEVIQ
jgi:hypothetical protein